MTLERLLQNFDRKERNWLIRDALGNPKLDSDFVSKLNDRLRHSSPEILIPDSAWWAIDYHFDWLIAALAHFDRAQNTYPNTKRLISGTNQDVDLLIAFENTVVVIETKATGAWDNNQLEKKLERLERFNEPLNGRIQIAPEASLFFVLASPDTPKHLRDRPFWKGEGKDFLWVKLNPPDREKLWRVERCNREPKPSRDYREYRIKREPNRHRTEKEPNRR